MKRAPRNGELKIALVAIGILGLLEWCPRVIALDTALDVSQYAHTAWKVRSRPLANIHGLWARP